MVARMSGFVASLRRRMTIRCMGARRSTRSHCCNLPERVCRDIGARA